MKNYRCLVIFLLSLVGLTLSASSALADDWKPIDPAHLAMKSAVVEKDADAEAIFWEVRVQDELSGGTPRTVMQHYLRIKVFNERGKESQSKIDIVYIGGNKVSDIAGRTIKPDGSIVELKKDAVFERTIVRANAVKLKAKSFAMPAVEPGALIEYRWREVYNDRIAFYVRLPFQRDIPVQQVKYYIKPLSLPNFPYGMRTITFHAETTPFTKEGDGFFGTVMTNVPAFHEEPRMPPEDAVRPWMLVYYSEDKKLAPEKFWKQYGKQVYEDYKSSLKVNDDVRKAAATIIGDATTPEQKLERLFEFCRTRIKNTSDDASGLTDDDRARLKDNKSPADTLKREMGTGYDIMMLFGSLASAAGFDARVANLSDRGDFFFEPSFADPYFLRSYDIAVKVGDEWRFFDPGSTYVPFGMLRWQEEGNDALISDPKEPVFVKSPMSPPEKSLQKRTATLKLNEDGTLEGDVRMEYTGHFAIDRKEYNDDDSAEQREQTVRDEIKERLSTAEISNIKLENVTDPVKPFTCSYHIRAPGYAQRTGKRLFLQPAFFQRGVGPLFAAGNRKHMVYFHYSWSEDDDVIIELPEGFAFDNADAPGPFSVGSTGKYDVEILVKQGGRVIEYKRQFRFKGMLFPVESYSQLKTVFDALHERDNHTITLKQSAASAN